MITASWASVIVALAVLTGALAGRLWSAGRREGKIDQLLEQQADTNQRVARVLEDHETRLRVVEHRRR